MFKTYQLHIFKKFIFKYLYFNLIFVSLIVILGVLEEISFFKDLNKSFLYPFLLTILNAPDALFEILPFIFFLSTQFLIFNLINDDELNLLKKNGLKNINLIKDLFFLAIFIGFFNILIFYNLSALMKFQYSNIKNNFSKDNKYLAMVTESGLWIKDNIGDNKIIIKSKKINQNYLEDTIINEFNDNYELIRVIKSNKIDIKTNEWIIYNPIIIENNIESYSYTNIIFKSNFNFQKINTYFSSISTLNILKLLDQRKDYKKLGYSTDEIDIYILRLASMPMFYGLLVVLASVLMFNIIKKTTSLIYCLILGILISVLIYYINFIFIAMGNNNQIPIEISVFFPMSIISIISVIGLIGINEK